MIPAFALTVVCSFPTGSNQLGSPHPILSLGVYSSGCKQLGLSQPDFFTKDGPHLLQARVEGACPHGRADSISS